MKTKLFTALILGALLHSNLNANDAANPCGALLCILGGQTSGECKRYYEYYTITLPKECEKECRKSGTAYGPCISACIPTKQITHLKNCKLEKAPANLPINNNAYNSGADAFIANLDNKINEASQLSGECSKSELNRVEKKLLRVEKICDDENRCSSQNLYGYRINPTPTKTCQILSNQEYSILKISYTCPKTFYEEKDWNNGYTRQAISKAVYENLAPKDREFELSYKKVNHLTYKDLPNNEKRIIQSKPDSEGRIFSIYQQIITTYYQRIYIQKDCWAVEEK